MFDLLDNLGHIGAFRGVLRPHTLDQINDLRAPLLA